MGNENPRVPESGNSMGNDPFQPRILDTDPSECKRRKDRLTNIVRERSFSEFKFPKYSIIKIRFYINKEDQNSKKQYLNHILLNILSSSRTFY